MTQGKFILLVEDNESDIELTRRALRRSNILNEVVVAEDGQAALDYLFGEGVHAGRDTSRQPDLVLLDLNLPRISGDEVLKRLRGREIIRRLPVFVFSTSNDERDVRRCRELGADDYVRKPVDFVQFAEEVTRLARRWLKLDDKPSDDAAPKHPQ
jgi:two-component system response regulator